MWVVVWRWRSLRTRVHPLYPAGSLRELGAAIRKRHTIPHRMLNDIPVEHLGGGWLRNLREDGNERIEKWG